MSLARFPRLTVPLGCIVPVLLTICTTGFAFTGTAAAVILVVDDEAIVTPGLPAGTSTLAFTAVSADGQQMLLMSFFEFWSVAGSTWDAAAQQWRSPQVLELGEDTGGASFSPDQNTMFFDGPGTRIFQSQRLAPGLEPGSFGTGTLIDIPGAPSPQLGPFFNGRSMYFSDAVQLWQSDFNGSSGTFETAAMIDEINLTGSHATRAWVSEDGDLMVFSQNRSGGLGGRDLYRARWNQNTQTWDDIKNLGPKVNSSADETMPSYAPGTQLLYFNRTVTGADRTTMQAPARIIPEPSFAWLLLGSLLAALRWARPMHHPQVHVNRMTAAVQT